MRNLILNTGSYLVWVLVLLEIILGIISLKSGKHLRNKLVSMVCFGLSVDALIIALGTFAGESAVLHGVSQIRYILHGILVPLLIPISFNTFGIKNQVIRKVLWCITGFFILSGITMGIITKTEPVETANILRYASSENTPQFARVMDRLLSFGGVIPLIAFGIANLIKNKNACLLLSGVFMFVFSALAPATGNADLIFLVSMIGEALMVLFFTLERKRF